MQSTIVLIGFMGTGKTTVGKLLAKRLNYGFYDSDDVIEERTAVTIPKFFAERGEQSFRKIEQQVISELLNQEKIVLATGGGAILHSESFAAMKEKGVVIALEASIETLWARLQDCTQRPLLQGNNPKEKLNELYSFRYSLYHQAHHVVTVDKKTPEQVVDEIINMLSKGEK